ncbi:hypothetical protein Nepgr_028757 [Nepenthes gracilis]|uniref:Uncharacterized protein n=1 Tax=Nepenthes gracilis TaxID=150966 RepID=A0AAD3TDH1_NEPGR|nr:hypothetical protein Nepgr_028757 [Nepenthes gracilis]
MLRGTVTSLSTNPSSFESCSRLISTKVAAALERIEMKGPMPHALKIREAPFLAGELSGERDKDHVVHGAQNMTLMMSNADGEVAGTVKEPMVLSMTSPCSTNIVDLLAYSRSPGGKHANQDLQFLDLCHGA